MYIHLNCYPPKAKLQIPECQCWLVIAQKYGWIKLYYVTVQQHPCIINATSASAIKSIFIAAANTNALN